VLLDIGKYIMKRCGIYDFETLTQDTINGVVLSMALLEFDEDRYVTNPYTYEELLTNSRMIKFDVEEQVKKYKRTINPDTLRWWGEQSKEAQKVLKPSVEDVSIDKLHAFIVLNIKDPLKLKKTYTRGNTFDCIFLEHIMRATGKPDPFNWRGIRDTRSMIEGMSWGTDMDNGYIPEGLAAKFIAHDPRHDIVMDVMRMQELARALA
jgi:hypothetical protein